MAHLSQYEGSGRCQCGHDAPHSILYRILNKEQQSEPKCLHSYHHHYQHPTPNSSCSCEQGRKVVLKNPEFTCRLASEVLLKTVNFIKNLPSFYQLPQEDQLLLIQNCWAPLFVLGLAQEHVEFEVKDVVAPSLLKRILLNESVKEGNAAGSHINGASFTEVQKVKMVLEKLWNLDSCAKEYAYLKGIILFNPDVCGLQFPQYIKALQQEAQLTLNEFILMMYSRNQPRFIWLLTALATLRDIKASTVTELFFRPVLGDVNVKDLLLETIYSNSDKM